MPNADTDQTPNKTGSLLSDAAGAATCFLLADLLKAHRSSAFTSLTAETVASAVLAALAYTILLWPLFALSRRFVPRWCPPTVRGFVPSVVAFLLFALIVQLGGGLTKAGWGFLAFLLIGHGAMGGHCRRAGWSPILFNLVWIASVTLVIAAMHEWNVRFYGEMGMHQDLTEIVIIAVGGLMALEFALGYLADYRETKNRLWAVLGGISAVAGFIFLLAPFGLLIFFDAVVSGGDSEQDRPNLLLITTDTMRADWCGVYGGPADTPAMTAVAEGGAFFKHSYSLGPWTLPAMFGLFASQVPPGLTPGAGKDAWAEEMTRYRFDGDTTTLATRLQEQGYVTGAYVGNSLLRDPNGILRGFEYTRVVGHRTPVHYGPLEALPLLQGALLRLGIPVAQERPIDSSAILAQCGESFLRAAGDRPFFLWVHFMDPHGPYAPPKPFAPEGGPWPVYDNADPHWGTPLTDDEGRVDLTDAEAQHVRDLYLGEIEYVDYRMGDILDALDREGLLNTTYIAMTSDHGEEFWDHGEYGHGHALYNELTRVPLIIAGPGIARRTVHTPVSAIDLMPTLAGLMNTEPSPDWEGVSLAAALRDRDTPVPASPVFAQGTNLYARPGPLRMVVDERRKLIRAVDGSHDELYDLAADPEERENLADDIETPGPLTGLMDALATQSPPPVGLQQAGPADGMSQELEEQMRAFGYLE